MRSFVTSLRAPAIPSLCVLLSLALQAEGRHTIEIGILTPPAAACVRQVRYLLGYAFV